MRRPCSALWICSHRKAAPTNMTRSIIMTRTGSPETSASAAILPRQTIIRTSRGLQGRTSITMLVRSGDQLRGEVGKAGQQVDALGGDELDADVVGAGIEVLGDPRSDLFCVT